MVITPSDIVIINITEEQRQRAESRAELKKNWTDTREIRNTTQRRYDFLMGQISEEAFKSLLGQNGKWCEYYDDVRTDNFEQADNQYDFLVKETAKQNNTEVGVKSSILLEKFLTLSSGNLVAYPYQVKEINVQAFVKGENGTLSNIVYLFGWATQQEVLSAPIGKLNQKKGGGATHNLPVIRLRPFSELFAIL
ncbi:MAG: hypothetical protein M1382_01250 [Candidatus Marsarchaeota archaeon]|nr:hypothetical protein [Candidatus Marsarchaeota archaeon]